MIAVRVNEFLRQGAGPARAAGELCPLRPLDDPAATPYQAAFFGDTNLSRAGENRRGIIAILPAMTLFTANDTLPKIVTVDLPPGEIMATRGVLWRPLDARPRRRERRAAPPPRTEDADRGPAGALEATIGFTFMTALGALELAQHHGDPAGDPDRPDGPHRAVRPRAGRLAPLERDPGRLCGRAARRQAEPGRVQPLCGPRPPVGDPGRRARPPDPPDRRARADRRGHPVDHHDRHPPRRRPVVPRGMERPRGPRGRAPRSRRQAS